MPKTLRGSFEQALRPLPSVVKGVQACQLHSTVHYTYPRLLAEEHQPGAVMNCPRSHHPMICDGSGWSGGFWRASGGIGLGTLQVHVRLQASWFSKPFDLHTEPGQLPPTATPTTCQVQWKMTLILDKLIHSGPKNFSIIFRPTMSKTAPKDSKGSLPIRQPRLPHGTEEIQTRTTCPIKQTGSRTRSWDVRTPPLPNLKKSVVGCSSTKAWM